MKGPSGAATGKPQSFLTDAQRAALDAALAAKQQEERIAKAHHHKPKDGDRKSRAAKGTGEAKKGGSGGKFTWGSVYTDSREASGAVDRNDPNYDSEDENVVLQTDRRAEFRSTIQTYKDEITTIMEEYFTSGDVQNAATSLEEIDAPQFMYWAVKKLVTLAMDKRPHEREMASVLLSALYGEVVSSDQMQTGFIKLLEAVDDLVLDVPEAVDMLALFVARAVVDDVLPPALVHRVAAPSSEHLPEVQKKVDAHLAARHSAERLLRCWGCSAGLSYSEAKAALSSMTSEYLDARDVQEARRVLHSLGVPFFHHELVRQAAVLAIEKPAGTALLVELLSSLSDSGDLSPQQLHKGLTRLADGLADLQLDNPAARERAADFLAAARQAGVVSEEDAELAAATSDLPAAPVSPASVTSFKTACLSGLQEYLSSADVEEVATRLAELSQPGLAHLLVKAAVVLGLGRKDRERELLSELLSDLHPGSVSDDQMAAGFTRLLQSVDDLVLDNPDAVHMLSLFLGRAVVDEALPPSFLASVLPALPAGGLGVVVVQSTGVLLSSRHAAERLQNCWHGGALTLDEIKAQIKAALDEFLVSSDSRELVRLLLELDVPHYHHELVKDALQAVFEKPEHQEQIAGLLRTLGDVGAVSLTQMGKGFGRVRAALEDFQLDYPHCGDQLAALEQLGRQQGWLPAGEAA